MAAMAVSLLVALAVPGPGFALCAEPPALVLGAGQSKPHTMWELSPPTYNSQPCPSASSRSGPREGTDRDRLHWGLSRGIMDHFWCQCWVFSSAAFASL